MSEIIKRYANDEITIAWQPGKCIHAENCAHGLPAVFNPEKQPWIYPNGSDSATIKQQIDQCPSGALSYEVDQATQASAAAIEINVAANGPLLLKGAVSIKGTDGKIVVHQRTTALCRCGASANKPYCDGAHKKVGFSDA